MIWSMVRQRLKCIKMPLKGEKVVLLDDLIATGGTMKAAAELVEELGGEVVKMLFLIELSDLNGREVLKDYDVDSVVQFEGK